MSAQAATVAAGMCFAMSLLIATPLQRSTRIAGTCPGSALSAPPIIDETTSGAICFLKMAHAVEMTSPTAHGCGAPSSPGPEGSGGPPVGAA